MRKGAMFLVFCWLVIGLVGCTSNTGTEPPNHAQPPNDMQAKQTVVAVVQTFGQRLQLVSLLAPTTIVQQSMQDNYGDLVSPALLAKWRSDPANAPGRSVSSPWPDRIEVESADKLADGGYQVRGEIIEITSVEQASGGVAAKRPIILTVKQYNSKWLIDAVTLGDYVDTNSILYINTQYGFTFRLPKSWQNYTIVTTNWQGLAIVGPQSGQVVQSGAIISIRSPQWTQAVPRQDIPVMVFTLSQWTSLLREEFSVGAAPIPPSELGRNSLYVFALPARYNYAFPAGFEEVETILNGKPLQPTESFTQ